MTRPMQRTVEWFVTAIRGYRDGTRLRPPRRPKARQALSLSLPRQMLDGGAIAAPHRRSNGADGLTTLCN
jgi:hypothetical protein